MRSLSIISIVIAPLFASSGPAIAERATDDEMERVCQDWLATIVDQTGEWAGVSDHAIAGFDDIVAGDVVVGRCFSIDPSGYVVVPILTNESHRRRLQLAGKGAITEFCARLGASTLRLDVSMSE